MSTESKIEWTERTWNPVAGCSMVSAGCINCYALRLAARMQRITKYAGTVEKCGDALMWTGQINLDETALGIPLKRREPTLWFVNSMSDLFHEDVPIEFVWRVWDTMRQCAQHTFQILTKRPARQTKYVSAIYDELSIGPLPNVWLGTSVEHQETADRRIPLLQQAPAAVHFLSCEPLLGPVDLPGGLDWVIVGGESGPGARPTAVQWIIDIAHQCLDRNIPVFVKQAGGLRPATQGQIPDEIWSLKQYPRRPRP